MGHSRYYQLTCTCLPAGNLVQRSIERVTLDRVPLYLACDAVGFFEHMKELEYTRISDPQQVCNAQRMQTADTCCPGSLTSKGFECVV